MSEARARGLYGPLQLSLRTSRILSLCVLVGIGIGYPLGALFMGPDGNPPIQLMPLHLVGLFSAVALFVDGRGMMTAGVTAKLDERERAMRDRAYVSTHQIMVLIMFGFCFWSILAPFIDGWMPGRAQAHELLTGFALVSMALPGIILAWREQPAEDEA